MTWNDVQHTTKLSRMLQNRLPSNPVTVTYKKIIETIMIVIRKLTLAHRPYLKEHTQL